MIALLGKNLPQKNSVCLFDETLAGENPNYKLLVLESTIVREDTYMQKTCDVAEKAILAKKNCGKSA